MTEQTRDPAQGLGSVLDPGKMVEAWRQGGDAAGAIVGLVACVVAGLAREEHPVPLHRRVADLMTDAEAAGFLAAVLDVLSGAAAGPLSGDVLP